MVRKPLNAYHHGDLRDALVQAALKEAEQGGPEAISIKALAKKLGVSQPAPYRHFADREALLAAVTAEAFRQFSAALRCSIEKPSKRSKLSRFAQATLDFGLQRNGIYRLMFASRMMACASKDSELHAAAMETFVCLLEALEAPRRRTIARAPCAADLGLAARRGHAGGAGAAHRTGRRHHPRGTGRGYRGADQTGAVGRDQGDGASCATASRQPFRSRSQCYYFGGLGSIGVVPRTPRISSSTLAPARSCASPRGGADHLQSDRQA